MKIFAKWHCPNCNETSDKQSDKCCSGQGVREITQYQCRNCDETYKYENEAKNCCTSKKTPTYVCECCDKHWKDKEKAEQHIYCRQLSLGQIPVTFGMREIEVVESR